MIISVLASGSNGNCTLVEHDGVSVLIDAGKSGKEIERRMNLAARTLREVDAVLITHAHRDHVSGAGVIARRYGLPLYMTDAVRLRTLEMGMLNRVRVEPFTIGEPFEIKRLEINPVATSHDEPSCGFVIREFGLFTDTGCVTDEMAAAIGRLKAVLIESNHEVEMLETGPYPEHLKARILSKSGHLSNHAASEFIAEKGANLSIVMLGHLSGENNTPRLAKKTFRAQVDGNVECVVCSREEYSGTWEI
jgi:phosphoribosyl 1,2-cyclic phosphodiesterase